MVRFDRIPAAKPFCASTLALAEPDSEVELWKSSPIGPVCGAGPPAVGATDLFALPVPHERMLSWLPFASEGPVLTLWTFGPAMLWPAATPSTEEVWMYWPF